MKIATVLFLLLATVSFSEEPRPAKSESDGRQTLTSRLSPAQVKEIAAARVRDTGYDVKGTDPWQLALQIRPTGNVWVAMLLLPNGPSPFHLFI